MSNAPSRDDADAQLALTVLDSHELDASAPPEGPPELVSELVRVRAIIEALDSLGVAPATPPPIPSWGPFTLCEQVGRGRFGAVCRGFDPAVQREIAVKLYAGAELPSEPRHMARVHHPNVVTVYGAAVHQDRPGIWMEFIHGQTLGERVQAEGPLPPEEVLRIGIALCDALAAVHAAQLIHQDVKPRNVMQEDSGRVVLMDFGAGLPSDGEAVDRVSGTPLFMAPEVLLGARPSVESDIYSLGVLLYYLLTGTYPVYAPNLDELRRHHERHHRAGTRRFVATLRELRPEAPAALARCLAKALAPAGQRYKAATEFETALETVRLRAWQRPRRRLRLWAGAAALLVAGIGIGLRPRRTPAPIVSDGRQPRLQVRLPPGLLPSDLESGQTTLALSPDGSRLVFAAGASGSRRLYDRPLDQLDANAIPGTEGANNPFFSPDGQWLGFDADGSLKTIRLRGGEATIVCPAPTVRGASWGDSGTIVFTDSPWSPLVQVPASGGTPRAVTRLGPGREASHRWPQILPGGTAAVFSMMTPNGREEDRTIEAVTLSDGRRRVLVRGATYPRYVATGHLLYARAGSVHAAPFDPERLEITGPARVVLDDVLVWSKTSGAAYFDVSPAGTLVYMPGPSVHPKRLVWIDRHGRLEPLGSPPRPYMDPALSPDGQRLAVAVEGPTDDIYVHTLERDTRTRLTFEGDNRAPAWSPDGTRIAFTSTQDGARNLYWVPADGSGRVERLTRSPNWQNFVGFAPDGKSLVFTDQNGETGSDIWQLPLEGDRTPRPLVVTPAIELFPVVSPDGRWLAYTSTESRREEVYVQPFPAGGRKWVISKDGGSQPVWSPTGRELFYRNRNRMMVVPVATAPEFRPADSRVLFDVPFDAGGVYTVYSVSQDAQRFLMRLDVDPETAAPQIVMVMDWFAELRSKLR